MPLGMFHIFEPLMLMHSAWMWTSLAERNVFRVDDGLQGPDTEYVKVKNLITGTDTICGGPEIWTIITKDPTSTGVRDIKWGKVDATAQSFLNEMDYKIHNLKHKIELQGKRIDEARTKETKIKDITADQIKELVTGVTEPFGGLEEAKRTMCGVPSIKPRAPRKSFLKSEEKMDPALTKVFTGHVRMGQAPFLETCNKMLPCKEVDTGSRGCYCNQLCQRFRDKAQRISDKTAGEHAGVCAKLERQAAEWEEELEKRKQEKADCAVAKEKLVTYSKQLGVLHDEADKRFEALRKAEEMLEDAQWDLGDIEDKLLVEQEAAEGALEALKEAESDVKDAQTALENLQDQQEKQNGLIKENMDKLAEATDELQKAKDADSQMSSLKELVSITILKMQMFFNEVVEQRLDKIGINLELDVGALFGEKPDEVNSASSVTSAVDVMHNFCRNEGKVAIDNMKDKLDLGPLCSFGTQAEIEQGIHEAALDAVRVVKERLELVKDWINPYRGQADMDTAKAEALVKQGEPAGLREVSTFFGQASFYKYLENWKVGGLFLKLLAQLETTTASLSQRVQELQNESLQLKAQFENTTKARDKAETELKKVAEAKDLAEDKKAEILKKVEQLKEEGVQMQKSVDDYEAMVEAARKKYNEALKKIEQTHKESTSFLELWSRDDRLVASLREEVTQARDAMLGQRIQASVAENRFNEALGRLSEAEEFEELRRREAGVLPHARFTLQAK